MRKGSWLAGVACKGFYGRWRVRSPLGFPIGRKREGEALPY